MTYDLLVIGDANPDVVVGPVEQPILFGQRERLVPSGALLLGGSAAIMACGAARLGLRVAFVGRVGADPAGDFVRTALADRGVDVSALIVDPALPTPLTTVLTSGDDRAMLTSPGCMPSTTADDVPLSLLRSTRHVHAASFYLMPALAAGLAALFKEAKAAKATTSLDPNDDPTARWDRMVLDPVLRVTDYFLPNAAEAQALTGHPTVPDAAGILARRGPLVVVKNGAAGALKHDGVKVTTAPALQVDYVDAVGAGDSFDAGFVAAVLKGAGRDRALALAAACGSLSTRAPGGTAAQPTWDEAIASVIA
ncbi:carbohydrate kinase family protein [Kribbella sandramycini]|uniref:Carbohydrate kinase family protein n=1 Tax=Kribbella sandramycini TaxID=60450 RepID=A0A7Y4P2T4_9ACTN|nr:carbohydrate kinase family protein [Kribbella sandramycini]MBB6567199.1 sugar/nucleoside kinase (ribokinase family) [Kribbella sandramycini]NOL45737.1 carbohydrate kinase family protein [Kribbella sandramycini]